MNAKDLHPGLGSGALREALEQRIKECREMAERWETESRNVRIDRAIHKDYSLTLNALANLLERALSLSSPIEPPPVITPQMMSGIFAKSVNNSDPEHDHVYDHRIAAAEINRLLGGQASSEIREALDVETLARAGHRYWREQKWANDPVLRKTWLQATPEFDGMNGSAREMFLTFTQGIVDALAPSRQAGATE